MFRTSFLFIFLVFFSIVSLGQNTTVLTFEKKGTVNFREAMKTDLSFKLENIEAPAPDGNSTRAMLNRKKSKITEKYPRQNQNSATRSIEIDDTLRIGKSFLSNTAGRGTPNDNSMAISNAGIVFSSFNSAVFVRDTENDTTLGELTLNSFSAQIGMNYDNFDPKTIYDPENDRFILIYLAGRTPTNSYIVVCFSETNDPMGNWNVYSLSGNPLNDNSWSDYPAISMTKEEVFITINLLNPGGTWQTSFKQTVIWQIDKTEGYTGAASINPALWSDLKEGGIFIRNMHPVRGGFDLKSKTQYFLSNRNFANQSDSIYLLKINNTIASGASSVNIKLLHANLDYYLSPNAEQSGNRFFATNDSRVLGGIVENEKIQFVQNSLDPISGNCAVYHGVISNLGGSPSVKGRLISDTNLDFGYPNIVYGGLIAGEDKSVIGFNHTSTSIPAGNSAVYFDGANYSQIKEVKKGSSRVQYSVTTIIRWGDYFGMQRKYNEPCNIWLSGYYGNANKNYTWVSEVMLPGDCFDTIVPPPFVENTLFPNPSSTQSEIHFTMNETKDITVDLISSNGKLVRTLYQDRAKEGENRLTFDTENLSIGIYYLRIYSGKETILVKKLVRN